MPKDGRGRLSLHGGPPMILAPLRASAAMRALLVLLLLSDSSLCGDILRGGATRANDAARAQALTTAGQAQALKLRANAQDRLARTTQALQQLQAAQVAARSAAASLNHVGVNPLTGAPLPDVPDGLGPGALDLDRIVQGAKTPVQSGNTVTVEQTAALGLLHWKTFNVGRNTTLNFDQSAGGADAAKWIAFNKVTGADVAPSQILGRINAQGQVYVVNQNGIIFGGSSQINTRTFVASSLPLNEGFLSRGLLNQPQAQSSYAPQFQFSGVADGSFVPSPPPAGRFGDVTVRKGAVIRANVNAEGGGGRVMLVGPNVRNEGTIETPSGQTVLAAGLQVGFQGHASSDPSLRGLDVFVGKVDTDSGSSVNQGVIDAGTGNISMIGRSVVQNGAATTATGVTLNGRIDLDASYDAVPNSVYNPVDAPGEPVFLARKTGSVAMGSGSVTAVMPSVLDPATTIGAALPLSSKFNARGGDIQFAPGSIVRAPGGDINVQAGSWREVIESIGGDGKTVYRRGEPQFVYARGSISVGAGALLDAAGSTEVFVPLDQSILSIQLRGSELAVSPLQRDGRIRGESLTIDMRETGYYYGRYWIGTPLGDATGFANIIGRNAAQLTANGGSISLRAGGSIAAESGSIVDVSGGYYRNEGGKVETSRLWQGGRLVPIDEALPGVSYSGIYTPYTTVSSSKWGVAKLYRTTLDMTGAYDDGEHISGAAGGSLSLTAPIMNLQGSLLGQTVNGPRQLRNGGLVSRLAPLSSFRLAFTGQSAEPFTGVIYPTISPLPVSVVLGGGAGIPLLVTGARGAALFDSEFSMKTGFGDIEIENGDGDYVVPERQSFVLPVGGSLKARGKNFRVGGSIAGPGANVDLIAYAFSPYEASILKADPASVAPAFDRSDGSIVLGEHASIDTAGLIIDEANWKPLSGIKPVAINGGRVSLTGFNVSVPSGSKIDVSGGLAFRSKSDYRYGNGGTISLTGGNDPELPSLLGGRLTLGGALSGYSGKVGGALNLTAPLVQIGGRPLHSSTLLLSPEFFSAGGFSHFALTGTGILPTPGELQTLRIQTGSALAPDYFTPSVYVAPGTSVQPLAVSSLYEPPIGSGGGEVTLRRMVLPHSSLREPVSLALNAPGIKEDFNGHDAITGLPKNAGDLKIRGDIVLGAGSALAVEPGGSVSLRGQTVAVYGDISAHGGKIDVVGAKSFPSFELAPQFARATAYISHSSRLSTAGTVVSLLDDYGRRHGSVLSGGRISVSGNVFAEQGAVLDVSGAAGQLDLTPIELGLLPGSGVPASSGINSTPWMRRAVAAVLESDAGHLNIEGKEMLVNKATMIGRAGGPSASGGTLAISSGRFYLPTDSSTSADANLQVTRTSQLSLSDTARRGAGFAIFDATGSPLKGSGFFSVDQMSGGGFASLKLGGNPQFFGNVDLALPGSLSVGSGGIIRANADVLFTAPYVQLGQEFTPPHLPADEYYIFTKSDPVNPEYTFAPHSGPGSLVVRAETIDLGNLSLENIGRIELHAPGGEIRGGGTMQIAGEMVLEAASIYPVTATTLGLFAYGHEGTPGRISILGSGHANAPLSAAGSIIVQASEIIQNGLLHAPFGRITLGWDGAGAAPLNPIAQNTIATPHTQTLELGPGSVTSVAGIDPVTGASMLVPYGVSFDGLSWIDPSGQDITDGQLLPDKQIKLSASALDGRPGSVVDLRGGGDLFAFQWVRGNGGPIDLLSSDPQYQDSDYIYGQTRGFAVVPEYASRIAPFAPFNGSGLASNLDDASGKREAGYVHERLGSGDRVYFDGSTGLTGGFYTLLPARYALLPGAFLVTPLGPATGKYTMEDGSSIVGGYRLDGLAPRGASARKYQSWEVVPSSVLAARSEYRMLKANDFLPARARALGLGSVARLPADGGYLLAQGNSYLRLDGTIFARPASNGRGAWADIASDAVMLLADDATKHAGDAVLSASSLSSSGIESIFLGGRRTGSEMSSRANAIIVDNPETPVTVPDFVLAARQTIDIFPASQILAQGTISETTHALHVSGEGAAARISASSTSGLRRSLDGMPSDAGAMLRVGAGVDISGAYIALDSSAAFSLDSSSFIKAGALSLGAGQISVLLGSFSGDLDGNLVDKHLVLNLDGGARGMLDRAGSITLSSYRTVDFYGSGLLGAPTLESLHIAAGGIRGFQTDSADIATVSAGEITLSNPSGIAAEPDHPSVNGTLRLEAGSLALGNGSFAFGGYGQVAIDAPGGVIVKNAGSLNAGGSLSIETALLTAADGAAYDISASGFLNIAASAATDEKVVPGLGGRLGLKGTSVSIGAAVQLPAGALRVSASSGDVFISGDLDVSGRSRSFFDVDRYIDAGSIALGSTLGAVVLADGSVINVQASPDGGNAGSLAISSSGGIFTLDSSVRGAASRGRSGTFSLDAGQIADFDSMTSALQEAGFREELAFRVRAGDVNIGRDVASRNFVLSADGGSIRVDASIDASGERGGSIRLAASGDVLLSSTGRLDVSGQHFSSSGKGGSVVLEAGVAVNGIPNEGAKLQLAEGGRVDLSVADYVPGGQDDPSSSAFDGQFEGTLHLRAPRIADGSLVGIGDIRSEIVGGSSILAEGFKIYESDGKITRELRGRIDADARAFLGDPGVASAAYDTLLGKILSSQPGLESIFVLAPGAEILNLAPEGDLVLGSSGSGTSEDWNLAPMRYGPKSAPGVLTLRSPRDIVLYNAISDGFTPTAASSNGSWLWLAPLSPASATAQGSSALPLNTQSWSYRFTAGADLAAADYRQTADASELTTGYGGSLRLGKDYGNAVFSSGANALTSTAVNNRFQVIRTGTGNIDITAAGDVVLLNQFASVYTAGARLRNYSQIYTAGDFALPTILDSLSQGDLGAVQRTASAPYYVQYSAGGGDVRLSAGKDLRRATVLNGAEVDDSSRQLPSNWLYRRGYVDPVTGEYGIGGYQSGPNNRFPDPSSTTWWVDFSNFFAGVGALGGGNVFLDAARDIRNFDASIPTSARAPAGVPDAELLHETGGGDLLVRAGRDIDAGVYYVERGSGILQASGSIKTNPTRSLGLGALDSPAIFGDPLTWLPTSLFLGKGSFDVAARGDILLGPVGNAFLLPPGVNNRYWNKSYFSTYAPSSRIAVSSFGGSITHRLEAQLSRQATPRPLLALWSETQQLLNNSSAAYYQPWLRLSETSLLPFDPLVSLAPPSIVSTAFTGDINIAGDMRLYPAARGSIELLSSGAVNGLQPVGYSEFAIPGELTRVWKSSTVNLSDTDPARLPGVANPLSATAVVGRVASSLRSTASSIFTGVLNAFADTGSYSGGNASAEVQGTLHSSDLFRLGDNNPARIYASGGNVEGLGFFSAKSARIFSGADVADVAFYLQNLNSTDTSVVASGRDILPYASSGPLRSLAAKDGNLALSGPLAGDIQISGPGHLDVIAGRNIDLGTGANNADGTGTGITSIGNLRNPFLPFTASEILLAAGFGPSTGLGSGALAVDAFLAKYVDNADPALTADERARLAVRTLFAVLARSAASASANGDYSEAQAAVKLLFGDLPFTGDIVTHSREIKTRTGGAVTALAPGGAMRMASSITGQPLAPPGVVTEFGGPISILTDGDVDIGKGRIFTLRGGDITIWSSSGDIAAGTSAKTVVTAPPTRVVMDVRTAEVQTDLGGLATGGGIGVLASVAGVKAGSVALLAPNGTVDAGDAGIRATGDITIAAAQVLNADNISAGGTTVGAPSAPVAAAPNIAGLSSASTSTAATSSAAADVAQQARPDSTTAVEAAPSTITVEVLGYGGGESGGASDKEQDDRVRADGSNNSEARVL